MKKILRYLTAAGALTLLIACGRNAGSEELAQACAIEQDVDVMGFCPDSLQCVEGTVKSGQFFSTLMMNLGLDAKRAYDLTQACDTTFDVKTLRVGNKYKAYYDGETLEYVVYTKDKVRDVIFKCSEPYKVTETAKSVTIEKKYADVTINSSLWNDMMAAGVSHYLILDLSDIYAWTVDFFGLQKGDRFRVLYDEKVCDGETIAIDTVRYAVFSHAGRDFPMVMFNQGDKGNIWWDETGASMRKAFLKAPLKYSRVSSGFSYARRHPVTRRVQPHTGVDYAAPKGTPVMTIGDGVVTSCKYEGAGGNTIRIKHNSVYSTAYLHLSKYAPGIKAGTRVRQGEVIGYVGSTGRSTGPHLDFRVWKNGTPINPLTMDSPPAEPIKAENKEAFEKAHEKYKAQITSIQAGTVSSELFKLL